MVQHEQENGYHWREYPPGRRGVYGQTLVQTSAWFGWGAALAVLIAIIGALFTELSSEQVSRSHETALPGLSDLVGVCVLASLLAGLIAWMIACVSWCVRDTGVSTSLVRAARGGAPRTAVPHPRQVACVIRPRFGESWWTIVVIATLTTATTLLMLVILLSGPEGSLSVALGLGLPSVALWALFYLVHHVLPARHARRREIIASHWTITDEAAAWSAARNRSQAHGHEKGKRHPTLAHGRVLSWIAVAIGLLAYLISFIVVLVYKPSRLSPQRELSQHQDLGALRVLWVMLALVVIALILVVVGLVMQQIGRRAEIAALHSSTSETEARQPSTATIAAHSRPHSPPWFRLLVTGASLGLCLGSSVLLTDGISELSERGNEFMATLRPLAITMTVLAVAALVAAVVLTVARHGDATGLRNRLYVRFPVLPASSQDIWSDKVVPPARLHPQSDQDLTAERRQDPSGDS